MIVDSPRQVDNFTLENFANATEFSSALVLTNSFRLGV